MTTLTIVTVNKDSPGAGQFTIVGTYTDTAFSNPAQAITVENAPTANTTWSRAVRLTEAALMVMRNGANSFALDILTICSKLAPAFEPTLTWSPKINTQPSAATTAFAKQVLTASGTVSDGDQVVCGGVTYTFKTTLTPTAGQVLINGSAANALINLKRAIDHAGTAGTDYANSGTTAVANPQVKSGTITAATLQVIALATGTTPNGYATTETGANLAWGAVTMAGGVGTSTTAFTIVSTSELSGTTYAWYESADGTTYGSALTNTGIYTTATTASLTLTLTDTTKNGYYYKCTATNSNGATTSDASQLTVT